VPIGRAHDDFVDHRSNSVTKWVDAPPASHQRLASNKRLTAIDICET
jgi:hypothetical protein